jgi:NitT/TauT family transport system ATP-binding protein
MTGPTSEVGDAAVSPAATSRANPVDERPPPLRRSAGAAVSLRKICRVFAGGVKAIEPIDLEIAAGEFVAILGPSGCGKSTLLRIISGLDRPTAGELRVESAGPRVESAEPRVESAGPRDAGAAGEFSRGRKKAPAAAFVFQDAQLLPWRNVLKNVALPLELIGVPRTKRLEAATRAIEQVGLADAIRRMPAQLSGGMRMRVSLARALVTEPDLLLLDEPFAALDEITRQKLDEQLRALWASRGMTTIFVTHSTAEAVFLADRAIVLSARPARVVEDRPIDLPAERAGPLRATPEFARQTRHVYEALERGGA